MCLNEILFVEIGPTAPDVCITGEGTGDVQHVAGLCSWF
jgi:hypothetical protein